MRWLDNRQIKTNMGTMLIGKSTSHVERGVTLVEETGTALHKILEKVTWVTGAMTEFAASADEQANGLAQVNSAVNQMD